MSETAVLAAIAAQVRRLGVAAEVYSGEPLTLPRVARAPHVIVRRDDQGVAVEAGTLRYDRWSYGVELLAVLGGPSSGQAPVARRLAVLAPALAGAWTADPTGGGAAHEIRYAGDSSNLSTYRAAKIAPTLTGRLRVTEWVRR